MDANIVIAALMRDAETRRLLVLGGHEIHAPEYLVSEVEAHVEELSERAGLSRSALEEALRILRGHMTEHSATGYEAELTKARSLLNDRDMKDAPYVALALALGADGIWSQDRGLVSQGSFRVYRTVDLLRVPEGRLPE